MKKRFLLLLMALVLGCSMLTAAHAEEPAVQIPELSFNAKPVPASEGQAFVDNLQMGFNLGNAFDANECNWLRNELDYESAWCGAKTTEALLDTLYASGFRTIRLPVSWHNHVDADYNISTPWLDRVQEVTDWAIARGFYVILNIHHDNTKDFLYPTEALKEQSLRYMTAIWTQLADRFAEYDEHLIFESMNEPRMVGHNNEWWIDNNNADCKESIAVINELNQNFVNVVRAAGGKNTTRYLLCPGYDASPEGAMNAGFVLPTDPVAENDKHIIVGVHAYTPYSFALDYPGTTKWSLDVNLDKQNTATFMENLYKRFVSVGQPVIISEFGARDKGGNLAARVEFTAFYVASARARGMTCVWWDNNAFVGNGELFGIVDRKTATVRYPEIVEAMNRYAH